MTDTLEATAPPPARPAARPGARPAARSRPSGRRLGRVAKEVLLTLGAVLGTVCLLLTAAGWLLGVQPLVFRSGSMSPAIDTGALGIARSTPAADLRPGDIVSVPTGAGNRVTHRLVESTPLPGGERVLVLKGDANRAPDASTYTVRSAYRVVFHIPEAGYVVSLAGSRSVQFGLGVFVTGMLLLIFRRPTHHDDPTDGARGDDQGPGPGPDHVDGSESESSGPRRTPLRQLLDEPRHRQPATARSWSLSPR